MRPRDLLLLLLPCVLLLLLSCMPVPVCEASLRARKLLMGSQHTHLRLRATSHFIGKHLPAATTWRQGRRGDLFYHREPRYHVYALPPEHLGFEQCNVSASPDFKHNIDKLFVHKLMEEGQSVAPEQADIFIIPELLSQRSGNICKHSHHWEHRLRDFLEASPWFQRHNGSDHLIIGDHYRWSKTSKLYDLAQIPGRVIVGHFEAYHSEARLAHRFFPVGYSTYAALHARGWHTSTHHSEYEGDSDISSYKSILVPFAERKYDVSFIGQVDERHAYSHRRELGCSWLSAAGGRDQQQVDRFHLRLRGNIGSCSKTADDRFSLTGKPFPMIEAMRVMQQSRYFLHLTGDTPSTDRLCNAFDTLTIPIALASKVDVIIDNAPFPDVVPWRDIIVTVEDAAWEDNPVKSVLDTIDSLSLDEVVMKYELMKRHADDVSFANLKSTRAHTNIINAAWKIAMEQLRELTPVVERAKPHDNIYWPPFYCVTGSCAKETR